jgi:hypothetical protein
MTLFHRVFRKRFLLVAKPVPSRQALRAAGDPPFTGCNLHSGPERSGAEHAGFHIPMRSSLQLRKNESGQKTGHRN